MCREESDVAIEMDERGDWGKAERDRKWWNHEGRVEAEVECGVKRVEAGK